MPDSADASASPASPSLRVPLTYDAEHDLYIAVSESSESTRYKGWTVPERLRAIHWLVFGIWVVQVATFLLIIMLSARP